MRIRTTMGALGLAAAAGAGLAPGTASATTSAEIVLTKVSSTVDSAAVLCNTESAEDSLSTAVYEVTLSGLTKAQLAGLRGSLGSASATSGLHMGWEHYIDEMGDATAEISTEMIVTYNGNRVARSTERDSGEQDTNFVMSPSLRLMPLLLRNGDVIRIEVTSESHADCNGNTSVFDQAVAQASTATYDGHTAHIDYSY